MTFPSEDERDYEIDHPLATPTEACREFARNVGMYRADVAWILTDYDTWERNPHYQGPPVRHPEEDPEDAEYERTCEDLARLAEADEDFEAAADAEALARASGVYDDIPF